ncbi:MAG: prephenate dehydrogenase [Firmicutes bacterium]|nr:prephenate dehydrogenase [Bacillota bacterium]
MKKIGVIGLGLIGGSVARAIKRYDRNVKIMAMNRREESLKKAFDENVIDDYSTTDFSVFSGCDIIFLCTPVDRICGFVEKLMPYIDEKCILTDVGSTKKSIVEKMREYENITFIGGHPMAGSEKIGYENSDADLFKDAIYIFTPFEKTPKEYLDKMIKITEILGAKNIILEAGYHDRLVAASSHIQHIIAAASVKTVKTVENEDNYIHTIAAGGFRDTTRIAASSADMWTGICFENKEEILKLLDVFKNEIDFFEKCIVNDDRDEVYNYFEKAKQYRDTFKFR